ncbi:MAG: purine phosphorylase [Sphingopyxis sp.]|nr:purine phosphorylase [Sphingopyxis sp.]
MTDQVVAVLAALPEEADAFFPGEGERDTGGWMPLRSVRAGAYTCIIATHGIGKVHAAAAAMALAERYAPRLFLGIGTAGKIGRAAGDCFWLESAVQHDYGAEHPDGFVHYTAGSWPMGPANVEPFRAMADPGVGLPHARIASGDMFVACPDQARFLHEGLNAELVDMETAAMAQLCALIGTPWAAIRATTDEADGASADDFSANLAAAARRAGEAAERLVGMLL